MGILDEFTKEQSDAPTGEATGSGVLSSFLPPPPQAPAQVSAPQVEAPLPEVRAAGEFGLGESLERGLGLTVANITGAFGFTDKSEQILENLPAASIPNFRQIEGTGTLAQFIGERTVENVPNIGLSISGGIAGGAIGGPVGAGIGFLLATGLPLLGESRREIKEAGAEGTALQALPSAAANTALEAFPVGKVARQLGITSPFKKALKEATEEAPEAISLLRKSFGGAKNIADLTLTEGAVEALQELNNLLAGKFFTDKEVLDLNATDLERLKQAAAGGAAGGAGTSITAQTVGTLVEKIDAKRTEEKKEDVRKSVESSIEEIIQQKKREIEGNEKTLADAAAGFQTGEFRVFSPLRSVSTYDPSAGTAPLPVGQTGFGPTGADDPVTGGFGRTDLGRLSSLDYTIGKDASGQSVFRPFDTIQDQQVVAAQSQTVGRAKTVISFNDGTETGVDELLSGFVDAAKTLTKQLGLPELKLILANIPEAQMLIQGLRGDVLGTKANAGEQGSIIGINLQKIANRATSREEAQAKMFETLTHEIGHAVIDNKWQGLDNNTKFGLLQGYREWLTDAETMSSKEWFRKYTPPATFKIFHAASKSTRSMKDYLKSLSVQGGTRGYLLSFDEYAAQMMARHVTGKVSRKELGISQRESDFWQSTVDALHRYWRIIKKHFGATETFAAFVDNMFISEEIRELEAAVIEINNPTGQRAAELNSLSSDVVEQLDNADQSPAEPNNTPSLMANMLEQMGLKKEAADMRRHQEVQLGFMRLAPILTPLQLSELARKAGISNPHRYMELVREFSNTKMRQITMANDAVNKWLALGNERSTKLGNFLFAVSDASDAEGRRLGLGELEALRDQHNLDEETFAMWREVDGTFTTVLENIERGLVLDAAVSFIPNPARAREFRDRYLDLTETEVNEKLALIVEFTGQELVPTEADAPIVNPLFTELERIDKSINELKNKNYFPRSRLGEYTITVKSTEKDQEWEGTTSSAAKQTLGFYAFDTKGERDAMLKALTPEAVGLGLSIAGSKLDSEVFAVMGMPEALIQTVMADERLELNEKQKAQLQDISLNLSPGKRFLKHLKKRKGIKGFNEEALRVYSNYMMSAANHLARVEHSKTMLDELQTLDNDIRDALENNLGGIIDDLVKVKDYYRRHFDYLMKPDNDWASIRAVGFLWYLGFNVKSALVNLTQIPMVTFPVLAARFGDRRSSGALATAYRDIPSLIKENTRLADDEMAMLDKLRQDGIIDESMVMELAGLGEASVLKRAIPGWKLDNILNKVSYYGGTMFRVAEKFNRNVTALASYRLAREAGQGHDQSVTYAREVIEKSQFEYAKFNRPEFMRGKKSVIFLFWQYIQHASFLFFGGEGRGVAVRMWMLALFIAGLEGLPFAKTLMAIIDFSGTQMQKALGVANPRVTLNEDMRELLLTITDKPDLIMRGLASQWGLGPLHLASLAGAPVPNIDVSGSLSFGSPIPFLDEAITATGTQEEKLGKFTAAVLGPIGGMALQAHRSATSTDPNTWKNVERAMPVFFKNAMQGVRWLNEGRETFKGEGTFLDMDNPEGRVGAIMKGLGFQSTRLSQKYTQVTAQQQAALFWTLRKQLLLNDYSYALRIGDREAKKDALDAVKVHNKGVRKTKGLRGLFISGKDLRRSIRAKERAIIMRERGIAPSRSQRLLFDEIAEKFPVNE